jgi:adenosylhomocysteine nucleosidase
MCPKREILAFAPTPQEYQGLSKILSSKTFRNFKLSLIESGPGKINAALAVGAQLALSRKKNRDIAYLAGIGTSGALTSHLRPADMVFSLSSIISDWRMEDGSEIKVGPYGQFQYQPASPETVRNMALESIDPLLVKLSEKLDGNEFQKGRLLTSDAFVCGREHRLSLGHTFQALACDMESGAFALGAAQYKTPWFNIRIVADTLEEGLEDYFKKEVDMTEILGQNTFTALSALDSLLSESL